MLKYTVTNFGYTKEITREMVLMILETCKKAGRPSKGIVKVSRRESEFERYVSQERGYGKKVGYTYYWRFNDVTKAKYLADKRHYRAEQWRLREY